VTRRLPTWGIVAVGSGLLGIAAALWSFPAPVQAILVAALVLAGPGAAVRNWVVLPPSMTAMVVPAIGLATVVLASHAAAAAEAWQPQTMLVVLALAVIVAGLTRWRPSRAAPVPAGAQPVDREIGSIQQTGERS
jgi:hypothetical protein